LIYSLDIAGITYYDKGNIEGRRNAMRKGAVLFVVAAMLMGVCINLGAAGTKDEAQSLVKKAIEYYKANGKEKGFAEVSNKKGKFVKDDLYVFVYDINGVCVAHGFNSKQIGKNLADVKDPDGKLYVKERIAIAKSSGSGWQDYKYTNPTTYKVEAKTAYIEKVDNYIFGCGAYK
jgi:cytochrome c